MVDCLQRRMYAVGPGAYEICFSPGSLMYPLKTSKAGHLMLPCAEYGRVQASTEIMTFVVGPHFQEWQEGTPSSQVVSDHAPDGGGRLDNFKENNTRGMERRCMSGCISL